MKYFNGAYENVQELRKAFKDLCKKLHPDLGGDEKSFVEMNEEYKNAVKNFRATEHNGKPDTYQQAFADSLDEEYREIIIQLLRLNIDVEICGFWLWLHGDTKAVKEQLKAMGCKWAPNKKLWYWRPSWAKSFGSKKKNSMEDIRAKYGSTWAQERQTKELKSA